MALQSSMLEGEHLLWSGRPPRGILFRSDDFLAVPFSLLWGGFAIFWEYSVVFSEKGAPLFFKIWGIPFVLVGLYLIVGRFFVDAWQRRRTLYGITDKRVLILTGSKLASLNLGSLSKVSLRKRGSGGGVINLGVSRSSFPTPPGWPGREGRHLSSSRRTLNGSSTCSPGLSRRYD
jgi:hypothetical protein